MVLRRLFLRWMLPAVFLLPLWLFVGWVVFSGGSAWALLWVFIAVPAVFVTQLIFSFLVRGRAVVRVDGAMTWADVGVFGAWHLVVIALGFFDARSFFPLLLLSVVGAVGLLWWSLMQLWRDARGSIAVLHTTDGTGYIPPTRPQPPASAVGEVIVVPERRDQR